jgi:hypothetical protein
MHAGSECPNDGAESFSLLSSILQSPDEVDSKYCLSPRAADGILRRAARRGKQLPDMLNKALSAVSNSK